MGDSLVTRLIVRAKIRRNIPHRKSVQEGKPDRIADLLDEAADEILRLESELRVREQQIQNLIDMQ